MSKMRFFALQELANRRPLEVITPSNKLSDYYGSHVFDRKKDAGIPAQRSLQSCNRRH